MYLSIYAVVHGNTPKNTSSIEAYADGILESKSTNMTHTTEQNDVINEKLI